MSDEIAPAFVAENVDVDKSEEAIRVKVTFSNGTSSNFELSPELGVGLVALLGRALDSFRVKETESPTRLLGGS